MNTVDDLRDVLLIVQVSEFEDEALHLGSVAARIVRDTCTHFGKTNLPGKVAENVDVLRMAKVQLGRLHRTVNQPKSSETPAQAYFVYPADRALALEYAY
jgi:hypothetical protein